MNDCLVSHPVEGWEEVAQWSVNRLSLGAVVYRLWLHRNNLIHGNMLCSRESLIAKIKWDIRLRLMGKGKYKRIAANTRLMQIWNLQNLS